jgi:glycosyltransferase involved in cell wall biosynthesis
VRLNCRGSLPEAAAYGAALSLWQRRLVEQADALVVPSEFARERLRTLGAPLRWERVHVLAPPVRALAGVTSSSWSGPSPGEGNGGGKLEEGGLGTGGGGASRPYALVVSRLSPEKGVDVAIAACRLAGMPLVIAGEGPERSALRELAGAGEVQFVGRVDDAELARLRSGASIALVPSRSAESFGMAAAEAMACGLPVAGSRVGALGELLDESCLAPPGDPPALAAAIRRIAGDATAGRRGFERVRSVCAPDIAASGLARVYGST